MLLLSVLFAATFFLCHLFGFIYDHCKDKSKNTVWTKGGLVNRIKRLHMQNVQVSPQG